MSDRDLVSSIVTRRQPYLQEELLLETLEDTDTTFLPQNQFHTSSPARPRSASVSGHRTEPRNSPTPSPGDDAAEPLLTTVQCDPLDQLVVFVAAESGFPLRDAPHPPDLNNEPAVVRPQGIFSPGVVLKSATQRPQQQLPIRSPTRTRRRRVRSKKSAASVPKQLLVPEMSSFIVPVPKCSSRSTLNGRPMSACSMRTAARTSPTKQKKRPTSACSRLPSSRSASLTRAGASHVRPSTAGFSSRMLNRPQSAPPSHERRVLQQMAPLSAKESTGTIKNHLSWGPSPKAVEVGVVALGCLDGIRGDHVNRSELLQVHSPKFIGGVPHRCRRVQGTLSYQSIVRQQS